MANRIVSVDNGFAFPAVVQSVLDARFSPGARYTATGGDETAALNTFLAAGSPLGIKQLIGSLSISGLLSIPANTYVDATKATITQTHATQISVAMASGSTLVGLTLVGKGTTDWVNTSAVYAASGISVGGATGVTIRNVSVSNVAGAAVYAATAVTNLRIDGCNLVGLGSGTIPATTGAFPGGITLNADGSSGVKVSGCDISGYAIGIVSGVITDVTISGTNRIHDNVGQHGIYLGPASRAVIANNLVDNNGLSGIKVQMGISTDPDGTDIAITGNVVTRNGSHGITVLNTHAQANTSHFRNIVISGNVVTSSSIGDGVNITDIAGGIVSGNHLNGGRNGVLATACDELEIVHNVMTTGTDRGIGLIDTTNTIVDNNRIKNYCTLVTTGAKYGIHVTTSAASTNNIRLIDNRVTDANAHMQYGLFITGSADQASVTVRGNTFSGATDYGVAAISAVAFREYFNNIAAGTLGPYLNPVLDGLNMLMGTSMEGSMASTNQTAPAAGVLSVVKVPLLNGGTLGNVSYMVGVVGVTLTSGQNLIGVYDSSGNLIGQSADQSAAWLSTGSKTTALVTKTTSQSGYVFVGFLWNGTTAPQFRGVSGSNAGNIGLVAPNFRFSTGATGLTALPSTLPTLTAALTATFVGIS